MKGTGGGTLKPELIEKAKTAKTAEELFELADDELDNIAGGGCGDPSEPPKFQAGDHVLEIGLSECDLLFPVACRSTY